MSLSLTYFALQRHSVSSTLTTQTLEAQIPRRWCHSSRAKAGWWWGSSGAVIWQATTAEMWCGLLRDFWRQGNLCARVRTSLCIYRKQTVQVPQHNTTLRCILRGYMTWHCILLHDIHTPSVCSNHCMHEFSTSFNAVRLSIIEHVTMWHNLRQLDAT